MDLRSLVPATNPGPTPCRKHSLFTHCRSYARARGYIIADERLSPDCPKDQCQCDKLKFMVST